MENPELEKSIKKRIRIAMGQINAIDRMIEDKRSYDEMLQQVKASKSAINHVGELLLEEYLQSELKKAKEGVNVSEKDISSIISKYSSM